MFIGYWRCNMSLTSKYHWNTLHILNNLLQSIIFCFIQRIIIKIIHKKTIFYGKKITNFILITKLNYSAWCGQCDIIKTDKNKKNDKDCKRNFTPLLCQSLISIKLIMYIQMSSALWAKKSGGKKWHCFLRLIRQ